MIPPYQAVNCKVGIFWDIENFQPPSGMAGYTVSHRFRAIASQFGSITVFKAYLDLHLPMNAKSSKFPGLCSELQSSGVSITDCPHTTGSKEHAGKMLLVDMMGFALANPSPAVILLITGDRDFAYGISVLRQHQYRVILVTPKNFVHPALTAQADAVVTWDQLFGSDAIEGTSHLVPDLRGAASYQQQALPCATADGATRLAIDIHPSSSTQTGPQEVIGPLVSQSVAQPTAWIAEVEGGSAPNTPASEPAQLAISSEDPLPTFDRAFFNLVDILKEIAPPGPAGELWGTVKDLLLAKEPDLLEKHQLSRSTDFLNWAEQEDIIIVQRARPRHIALHPRLQGGNSASIGTPPELKDEKKLAGRESPPHPSLPLSPKALVAADMLAPTIEGFIDPTISSTPARGTNPGDTIPSEVGPMPPTVPPASPRKNRHWVHRLDIDAEDADKGVPIFPAEGQTNPPAVLRTPVGPPADRSMVTPQGSASHLTPPSNKSCIPPQFRDLVSILRGVDTSPSPYVKVASLLHARNPNAWVPGKGRFESYIRGAEKAGVVTTSAAPSGSSIGWIAISEHLR